MKLSQRYMHWWKEDSNKFRIYQPLYFNKSYYHLKDFPGTTNILKQGSKVLHIIFFQIWGTNAPDHPELGLQSPSSQRWNTHFEQDHLQTWSLDWHISVWSYNDKGFENSEKETVLGTSQEQKAGCPVCRQWQCQGWRSCSPPTWSWGGLPSWSALLSWTQHSWSFLTGQQEVRNCVLVNHLLYFECWMLILSLLLELILESNELLTMSPRRVNQQMNNSALSFDF